MAPSRKRQSEVELLKSQAADLWEDQREVLERANRVIRAASKHARNEAIARGRGARDDAIGRGTHARDRAIARGREARDEAISRGRDARDEAISRGRGAYNSRVRQPVASRVHEGRERLSDDVLPAVSTALGSALAILDAARNPEVRAALGRATSAGRKAASRAGLVKAKPSAGPGRYILIGLGIVVAAGVAYAAWQTLRADDDLWIDDEEITEPGDAQPS